MSGIVLDHVRKVFSGDVVAVDDVSLEIANGEFLVLVGPSGCGKSTLLRMIAGLEDVTDGSISIGDRDVTDLPPRARDIAMVFQTYALYPHMSVRENLGYGLKVRKTQKQEATRRVAEVAEMLGLDALLDRRPAALSGGQRQRVAMGRAIVREPQAFLMDEPLSNLDAKLRVSMRAQLSSLHARLGTTTIYVTHDQIEAMTLGERVAVMRDGKILQVDTPQTLYSRPVNLYVAAFIGSPAMNLVEATVADGTVEFGGFRIPLAAGDLPGGAAVACDRRDTAGGLRGCLAGRPLAAAGRGDGGRHRGSGARHASDLPGGRTARRRDRGTRGSGRRGRAAAGRQGGLHRTRRSADERAPGTTRHAVRRSCTLPLLRSGDRSPDRACGVACTGFRLAPSRWRSPRRRLLLHPFIASSAAS